MIRTSNFGIDWFDRLVEQMIKLDRWADADSLIEQYAIIISEAND